jgi:hypothetical protein
MIVSPSECIFDKKIILNLMNRLLCILLLASNSVLGQNGIDWLNKDTFYTQDQSDTLIIKSQSASCHLLDSLLETKNKFFLFTIHGDSFIETINFNVPVGFVLQAANLLNLTTNNRFYLINSCKIDKKRNIMSLYIEEYRKYKWRGLIGYAFTKCPYFSKCFNIANFKIQKNKITFINWEL